MTVNPDESTYQLAKELNQELRLSIPAYDAAMGSFVSSVIEGFISLEPVVGQIPQRATGHSGPTRNIPGPEPLDQPLKTVMETVTIHADVMRSTDVEAFTSSIASMAEQYVQQLARFFIATMEELTRGTGNFVDANERPLSWDLVLDALERIEIDFDDDGQPYRPSIVMHPHMLERLNQIEVTPEHRRRLADIFAQNKARWHAQKRTRRLPRRNQGAGV